MSSKKDIFTSIWTIKNFLLFLENENASNFNKPSFLSSPLFKVPFNQKWKFYFTLNSNKNNSKNEEYFSFCLHVYEGPMSKIEIECRMSISMNNGNWEPVLEQFDKNQLKKDFGLECLKFVKKSDFFSNNLNFCNNYVFSIKCVFSKFYDKFVNENQTLPVPQILICSQAKVKLLKANCFGIIENFKSKAGLKKQNNPIISFPFLSSTDNKNDTKYYMDLWLRGRWNILNSYISVAFRVENSTEEYENAHSQISIYKNKMNQYSKSKIFK